MCSAMFSAQRPILSMCVTDGRQRCAHSNAINTDFFHPWQYVSCRFLADEQSCPQSVPLTPRPTSGCIGWRLQGCSLCSSLYIIDGQGVEGNGLALCVVVVQVVEPGVPSQVALQVRQGSPRDLRVSVACRVAHNTCITSMLIMQHSYPSPAADKWGLRCIPHILI
jgi:hypothetical protein